MSLRKYIDETARKLEAPITGDEFDFHINESLSIECEVVEHGDDSYVIAVDQLAYDMLKEADAIDEASMCEQCGMGTMYTTSEGRMHCEECGYTVTAESASTNLQRARDAGIDVERNNIGDGYFIGRDVHDYGDNVKVAYNLFYLENPEGLENELVNAFREVGSLDVSPYRPKPEEVQAAAAQLKIKDMTRKATPKSLGEAVTQYNQYIIPHLDVLIDAVEQGREATRADARISWYRTAMRALDKGYKTHYVATQTLNTALNAAGIVHTTTNTNDSATATKLIDYMKALKQQTGTISEAEYQGRQVTLGKPSAGDVKKYKVYVRDPKTGNIKKVNFGDKNMSIKRDNPARRKNFRARHNCASKKDRTSAGYWSCRMWSKKPVSKILKGK